LSAIDDYDGDGRLAVKLLTRDNTNYRTPSSSECFWWRS